MAIPAIYDLLSPANDYTFDAPQSFCDGAAIVSQNQKFGIINTNGDAVVPLEYDSIYYFLDSNNNSILNGYVGAMQNGKAGVLNYRTGAVAVPCEYDEIVSVGEDGLTVVMKDGKYGILQINE